MRRRCGRRRLGARGLRRTRAGAVGFQREDHTAFAQAASQYAYDHGVVQTFSGDDLHTADHNYPANYGHAMLIQGTVPDTMGLGQNCTNPDANFCGFLASHGFNVVGQSVHLARSSMEDLPSAKLPSGYSIRSVAC